MSFKTFAILLVIFSVSYAKQLSLPPYIKRCSQSAPDFDECCLRNGIAAIPFIQKGDRQYNIPNMLPLIVPHLSVNSGPDFSIVLNNTHVYHLNTIELNKIRFDLKNRKIFGKLTIAKLEMIGQYEVNGKLLLLPINGKGNINITTDECITNYAADYILEERRGETYLKVTNGVADITVKRAYFDLTNLFNGNKELGDSTNKVLNENWDALVENLKPVLSQTVVDVGHSIINGFASHVPFKDIFLD